MLAAPKVASAVWQAIANALPERAVGSACGDCNWFVCGVREPDGKTDVFSDLPAGGWGGTPFNDGMNVTMDPLGNCMNMEAETAELMFPIAYEAFDIRQDSAGDGHHRGGVGSHLKIRFLCEGAMSVETARTREGTPGVNGGQRSSPQRLWHLRADGTQEIVGGLTSDNRWLNPLLRADTSSLMATPSGLKPRRRRLGQSARSSGTGGPRRYAGRVYLCGESARRLWRGCGCRNEDG